MVNDQIILFICGTSWRSCCNRRLVHRRERGSILVISVVFHRPKLLLTIIILGVVSRGLELPNVPVPFFLVLFMLFLIFLTILGRVPLIRQNVHQSLTLGLTLLEFLSLHFTRHMAFCKLRYCCSELIRKIHCQHILLGGSE